MFRITAVVSLIFVSSLIVAEENKQEKIPVAKLCNTVIYEEDILGKDPKDFLAEEIETEEKLTGVKLKNKEELVDKLIFQLRALGLQNMLKRIVDQNVLKKHIDEIVSEQDLETYFAKKQNKKDNLGDKKMYLYDKSIMDAYEYLDQHPNDKNAIEDAYDKFLAQTMGKWKTKEQALGLWESYVKAPGAREMMKREFNESQSLYLGVVTKKTKIKTRELLFDTDVSKRYAFILRQCAASDEKVKSYLESKGKSGKKDEKYEQTIINEWYLKEMEKLGCELYVKDLGTLKDIIFHSENAEDIMSQHEEK